MKLLHVSDWHLGRTTYGASRASDHDAVIDQMVEEARALGPDLVLHTGDLFDTARPSYDDMQRGVDALERLAALAPVVVVRGNHDSAALLALFSRMLGARSRIHFASHPRRPKQGGVLDFDSADGHRVRVAVLPFVHAGRVVRGFEDATSWTGVYAKRIRGIVDVLDGALAEDFRPERDVLLFAAHLHVDGATLSNSERAIHVSDDYASRADHLPRVSYAAFGHIHKPQALPSSGVTGAYAGSPLQLDFGEVGEQKRMVAVTAAPGRPAEVVSIPLTRGRELRAFTGTLEELAAAADGLGDALCKLTLRTAEPDPSLASKARELLPRAEIVQVVEHCAAREMQALDDRDQAAGDAREPSLEELFDEYLQRSKGTRSAPAARVREVFTAALSAIAADEAPRFDEDEAFLDPVDESDAKRAEDSGR